MSIGFLIAAALIVGIAVGFAVRRRNAPAREITRELSQKTTDRSEAVVANTEEFHGVLLDMTDTPQPCAAAKALESRVLDPREAPQLPLTECDASVCRCLFRHRLEMRDGERRIVEDRRKAVRFDTSKAERRKGKDRRRTASDIWRGRS